jgi:hypothetical protein
MAQNVFTGLSGSIGLLNANFTELYGLYALIQPSGGAVVSTADLFVTKATPQLALRAAAAGQGTSFAVGVSTLTRWSWGSDNAAEAGANVGSDYYLNYHADSGAYLGTAMSIGRASGRVVLGSGVSGDWTGVARFTALSNTSGSRSISAYNSHASAGSALAARVDSTACRLAEWFFAGGSVGTVTTNATTTAYNTSSDVRLKKSIADVGEFGAVIDSIRVRSFAWRQDNSYCRAGFIAQELAQVAPEAVSVGDSATEIEAVWGVDPSKLVPMLVAELQAVRRRLAALEAANA